MKRLKILICALLAIAIFAGAGVVVFAQKTASDLQKSQKEADAAIAFDSWMEDQGTSVLKELQKSVENWKVKMDEAAASGDRETAEKCAAVIKTQERLIVDFESYISSPAFKEHGASLTDEDRAYIDSILELLKRTE